METFKNYLEFGLLGELPIIIEAIYEEGQPEILHPAENAQPYEPSGYIVEGLLVMLPGNEDYSRVSYIGDELKAFLEDLANEDNA